MGICAQNCGRGDLLDALHFVNRDVGIRNARLGAIAAIFRANAALRVAQHADLHAIAETRLAHFARGAQQLAKERVGAIEDRSRFFAGQSFASEHALSDLVMRFEDV
jgi:hypothetical protein